MLGITNTNKTYILSELGHKKAEARVGDTRRDALILAALRQEPMTISEISQETGVDRKSVGIIIEQMIEAGWIMEQRG